MTVQGIDIALTTINDEDYISLTDIIKAKDGDFFISDWLRNRNTLEYLGAWESMFNPDFNYGEFAIIKSKAGLNNFKISIKEWHEKTNAICNDEIANAYSVANFCVVGIRLLVSVWRSVVAFQIFNATPFLHITK